jgi:hypothetical protein
LVAGSRNLLQQLSRCAQGIVAQPRHQPADQNARFLARYSAAIPFDSFDAANIVLARTNAFRESDEAEDRGLRLTLPSPEILADAAGDQR